MSSRGRVGLIVAGASAAAVAAFWLTKPVCACTPALVPVTPAEAVRTELGQLARAQADYHAARGTYAATLAELGVTPGHQLDRAEVTAASATGYDLRFAIDSGRARCSFIVRRPTDESPVHERLSCYEVPVRGGA